MARLTILYNPLDTSRRRHYEVPHGVNLETWLLRNEPAGELVREVWQDGRAIDPRKHTVLPGDAILVVNKPGELSTAVIGKAILQAIIAAAIGFVLSRIFAPSKPKAGNTPSPSQVYGIGTPKNAARLGEPIPALFGAVIAVPDYASQPYVEYIANEQYLRAILCIGLGEHQVDEMLLGDSSASLLPADVASYQIFQPADHQSKFGVIQAATGVRENVFSSGDVSDQELLAPNSASDLTPSTYYWLATGQRDVTTAPAIPPVINMSGTSTDADRLALLPTNPPLGMLKDAYFYSYTSNNVTYYRMVTYIATSYDSTADVPPGSLIPPPSGTGIGLTKWIGPFQVCKAGQFGTSIELDFVFAGGLNAMDNAGNLGNTSVTIQIERTPINDSGAAIGAPVLTTVTYTARANTAQRFTHQIAVAQGRYSVRVSRQSNSDMKASTSDRVNWTGLKFQLTNVAAGASVYGNVTLAVVKLRATNGIASDAASSIRFRVTRKLSPPAGGAVAATVNPADAFAEILCAPYGGNRPRTSDELDLVTLADARLRWAGHNGFNAIFDQPSTVWEALGLAVQTVSAAPLPVGSRMTVIQDGVQPVRAQMFTDANTVAGSFQLNRSFDRDGTPAGIRVEYRDPINFTQAAYLLPADAPDYETVSLFGCTSAEVAAQHARLIDNRRRLQRANLNFSTELEGLNCLPGDRIGVQATAVRWAQGARVVSVQGLVLTLDKALTWTAGQAHAIQLRDTEGHPVKVSGVQRGTTAYEVVLPSLPFAPIGYGGSMEPTICAFGIEGQEITDWTVNTMRPQGNNVAIEAVNYDPAVWLNAAAHLLVPLPFDEVSR